MQITEEILLNYGFNYSPRGRDEYYKGDVWLNKISGTARYQLAYGLKFNKVKSEKSVIESVEDLRTVLMQAGEL
jgi:hypothetical protein